MLTVKHEHHTLISDEIRALLTPVVHIYKYLIVWVMYHVNRLKHSDSIIILVETSVTLSLFLSLNQNRSMKHLAAEFDEGVTVEQNWRTCSGKFKLKLHRTDMVQDMVHGRNRSRKYTEKSASDSPGSQEPYGRSSVNPQRTKGNLEDCKMRQFISFYIIWDISVSPFFQIVGEDRS